VREKEVREVVSWPRRAGVAVPGEVVRGVRSRRMALDWRRAELKRVFCEQDYVSGRRVMGRLVLGFLPLWRMCSLASS